MTYYSFGPAPVYKTPRIVSRDITFFDLGPYMATFVKRDFTPRKIGYIQNHLKTDLWAYTVFDNQPKVKMCDHEKFYCWNI